MFHLEHDGGSANGLRYGNVVFTRKGCDVNEELRSHDGFGDYVAIFIREPQNGSQLDVANFRLQVQQSAIGSDPHLPVVITAHKLSLVSVAIQAAENPVFEGRRVVILSNLDDATLREWGENHPGQLVSYAELCDQNAFPLTQ